MEKYLRNTVITLLMTCSMIIQAQTQPPKKNYQIKLNVIADRGGESTAKYINTKQVNVKNIDYRNMEIKGSMLKNMLPIRTPEMSAGKMNNKHLRRDYPGMSFPVFVMGNDKLSRAWLNSNVKYLKKNKAVGLLVRVDTMKEFDDIKADADGLPIIPTYGTQMAQQLNINKYPFYVDQKGLHQ